MIQEDPSFIRDRQPSSYDVGGRAICCRIVGGVRRRHLRLMASNKALYKWTVRAGVRLMDTHGSVVYIYIYIYIYIRMG